MAEVVFTLGRPGSGKSTATRYMIKRLEPEGIKVARVKDDDILYKMFLQDRSKPLSTPRFLPADHNGFIVVDFSVLDEVLSEIDRQIQEFSKENDLIVVEF